MRSFLEVLLLAALIIIISPMLGGYIYLVHRGEKVFLTPVLGWLERLIYRLGGISPQKEMRWGTYAGAVLVFNLTGLVVFYLVERLQGVLPLNPQHLPAMHPLLALNTAVSFVTNTNWQAYSPEQTMSYLTEMLAPTVQNFLSAASGLAVAIALIRGLTRREAGTVGNFWVDLVRSVVYILLPFSLALAVLLVSQGVIQNFSPYLTVHTLEGVRQTLAMGPAASQEAIKEFGTNGGGIFNANSAHPFENPTPLTNFIEMLAMLAIPAALVHTFGRMARNTRQGWAVFFAMLILFLAGAAGAITAEQAGNPLFTRLGVNQTASGLQAGGNMEGKEVRFGPAGSALFAETTSAAACGAVDSMHDSFTPLGGMVPLLNIALGEVIFGGVGAGLYGMLTFVLLAVFIAGLMVGRTPEYLGKKVESREIKMAMLAVLVMPVLILTLTALAVVCGPGLAGIANKGPHGLSEIMYAYASAAGNNGSAFEGLNAAAPFYLITTALAMLLGRFLPIIAVLAIAGSMVEKVPVPPGPGTFPTDGPLFVGLLVGVILIVGALTFFPALVLGPVAEHLLMTGGKLF
ncbi:potassium-transporting ATPase subunit KdpA [Desulfotomaculum copahuensis]|uniref:Potassium-transporting ATPase potassium-binding subunit n=1 Tax=Desulfotomaculum copahuensis TaxID=1838280 RepID=A0A1B7LIE1_9FIRM|nr:potassium-transporting ATPase subunit KdpA [Desulfotomaculum copahuensis]OAT86077.1 potassium-transporting ATPase subunit KdpA [Desulfotomaculum copahuensis]